MRGIRSKELPGETWDWEPESERMKLQACHTFAGSMSSKMASSPQGCGVKVPGSVGPRYCGLCHALSWEHWRKRKAQEPVY